MNPKYQEWKKVANTYTGKNPAEIHQKYLEIFRDEPVPIIWYPDDDKIKNTNLVHTMKELGFKSYQDFFHWASENRAAFWEYVVRKLEINFSKDYEEVLDLSLGIENPTWFRGASLNIVESCFQSSPEKTALIIGDESSSDQEKITYQSLQEMVAKMAGGLVGFGLRPGDAVVLYAPLSSESIICYLALIKIGAVAVSVADSFSSIELKKRITISKAKAIITCSTYLYGKRELPIYEKVKEATEIRAIVFGKTVPIRETDVLYHQLLNSAPLSSFHYTDPDGLISIYFSSGTTKEPKAIPFTQITPVKFASDGYFHQDIRKDDVVTWTTGMGWMMAPWVIFTSLLNKATLSVYVGAATGEGFKQFAEDSKITVMGTIPSIVKAWKNQEFHKSLNWKVRLFSSTGEPSQVADYFYLMAMGRFKSPIIEYCGGTEIGGGYISGTVVQPMSPTLFTTPVLGLDFYLLKSDGSAVEENEVGEVYIIPPSVGLSKELLNSDHHKEYYEDTPKGPKEETLRRHGDAFENIKYNKMTFYRSVGRTDDVMNLGGIKISAVEIEEVLNKAQNVFETAAVSISGNDGGPERLVVFVVPVKNIQNPETLKQELQQLLKDELNPLFKIAAIKCVEELPRTASNKMMRSELRKNLGGSIGAIRKTGLK